MQGEQRNNTNDAAALKSLYPELASGEGLATVLGSIAPMPHDVKINFDGIAYAALESTSGIPSRTVAISVGAKERIFIADFWDDGILLIKLGSHDLAEVQRALEAWLSERLALEDFERRFPAASLTSRAGSVLAGTDLQDQWAKMERHPDIRFRALARTASQFPVLRSLFPFTSLNMFRFSKRAGLPLSYNLPYVELLPDASFVAKNPYFRKDTPEILARGERAEQVIEPVAKAIQSIGDAEANPA